MKNLGTFFALLLVAALSGCQAPSEFTFEIKEYETLKPMFLNTLKQYDILHADCTESSANVLCKFSAGKLLKKGKINFHTKIEKDGTQRILILDNADIPLATMIFGDLHEELENNHLVSADGKLELIIGHWITDGPCLHPKKPGQSQCCHCKKCPQLLVEHNITLLIHPEVQKPKQQQGGKKIQSPN